MSPSGARAWWGGVLVRTVRARNEAADRCWPGGSTSATMGGGPAGLRAGGRSAGASAAGIGSEARPVAIDWAITVTPPSAPMANTAAVAAVLVQFIGAAPRSKRSVGGSSTSRVKASSRSRSSGRTAYGNTYPLYH
jgi:hypothetical protein